MKTPIIAIAASCGFFVFAGYAEAGAYEDSFGGQEGVNQHFQGTDHRLEDRIDHLQRSDTNNNAWDGRQQAQIDNNTAWNDRQEGALRGMQGDVKANAEWDDRQEGVIRQNRGRLDEHDQQIAGNTDRSIGNQQAIGFLQETDAQLSSAIRETNTQVTDDRNASVQRDQVIADQVDYNEQVNAAYRRQSAQQFEQHGAAIESNAQAIADERHERKEMGKDLEAGISSAMALGSHHFDTNYRGIQLSVSGAGYRGESAQSLSAGGAITDSVFGSVAVSNDSRGNQGYSIQSTFKF